MQFDLNSAQGQLQIRARTFANEVLAGRAAERDRTSRFPVEEMAALADLKLLGINIPSVLGGSEAGVVAYAACMEEIARADASVAVTMAVTNMVGEVICRFGSEDQKRRWVPELTSGRAVAGAFALSEPQAGSDPASMRTLATKTKNGWRLDGTKQWITSGDRARLLIVWARTDQGAGGKSISTFVVGRDTRGLSVGKPEDKMGLRGSSTVPLSFDGCEIEDQALLGNVGDGLKVALAALDGGRIGIGAQTLGIGRAAFEESLSASKTRSELSQHHQFALADMSMELDAARLLVWRAASLKETAQPFSRQASMAKLFASEAAGRAVSAALTIAGNQDNAALHRYYRDARVTRIYEGTSEIQRIVIGRALSR